MKRSQPQRCWGDARAKVEHEGRCRVCGATGRLEAAHIISRVHDRQANWYVLPQRIIPLCAETCHPAYDAHRLDIWGKLSRVEEAQAYHDAGGAALLLKRIAPLAYRNLNENGGPDA